jgi:hypothetical protein
MATNYYQSVNKSDIESFDDTTSDETIFKKSINPTNKYIELIVCLLIVLVFFVFSYAMLDYYYVKTYVIGYNIIHVNTELPTFEGYIIKQTLLFGKNITCTDKYDLSNNIYSEQTALDEIQSKYKLADMEYKYVNPIFNICFTDGNVALKFFEIMLSIPLIFMIFALILFNIYEKLKMA